MGNEKIKSNEYQINVLKNKIRTQIANHQREMDKKNKQFDFYEGRKIEAEIILSWIDKLHISEEDDLSKGER